MEEGQNVGFTSLSVPTRGPRRQQGGLPQRGHYCGPFDPTLLAGSMGNDSKHWQALGEAGANTWKHLDHWQPAVYLGPYLLRVNQHKAYSVQQNKLTNAKVTISIGICLEPIQRGWSQSGCLPVTWPCSWSLL